MQSASYLPEAMVVVVTNATRGTRYEFKDYWDAVMQYDKLTDPNHPDFMIHNILDPNRVIVVRVDYESESNRDELKWLIPESIVGDNKFVKFKCVTQLEAITYLYNWILSVTEIVCGYYVGANEDVYKIERVHGPAEYYDVSGGLPDDMRKITSYPRLTYQQVMFRTGETLSA
jgi:hypothetical protein